MCVAADELEFGNNVYHIKFDKSCSDKVHILTSRYILEWLFPSGLALQQILVK